MCFLVASHWTWSHLAHFRDRLRPRALFATLCLLDAVFIFLILRVFVRTQKLIGNSTINSWTTKILMAISKFDKCPDFSYSSSSSSSSSFSSFFLQLCRITMNYFIIITITVRQIDFGIQTVFGYNRPTNLAIPLWCLPFLLNAQLWCHKQLPLYNCWSFVRFHYVSMSRNVNQRLQLKVVKRPHSI